MVGLQSPKYKAQIKTWSRWFTPNAIQFLISRNLPETEFFTLIEVFKKKSREWGRRIYLKDVYRTLKILQRKQWGVKN